MEIKNYITKCQERANFAIQSYLPCTQSYPPALHEAMAYSVLNGGKRIRAAFVYSIGELFHGEEALLDGLAAVIEMIHAFSLIHDDLPALDNDDLRRGKPTCHKVYGEAVAILAGDALHTLAFNILANLAFKYKQLKPENGLKMIDFLTRAIGSTGMVGGEVLDLQTIHDHVTVDDLETIYRMKTGCLISAAVVFGALASTDDLDILHLLQEFGLLIGIAFQIHDDIIGIESSTSILGKCQGNDLKRNKPIYPVLTGINKAKKAEKDFYCKALSCLDHVPVQTDKVRGIADFILQRNY
ncbi:geranyltranstransferase [Legionella rubrilucens]|uniref:Geranyltranstransferase n=1 Tax=Legionella rubrilucens TaxID=458 RepID=A0A0W0XLP1_9GAMM|nr:farnesyl diphosphate synthase [Legionella rubrilucens]KTD45546.1 geranyltranstransferase [Legionella rubrilucens]